MKRSAIPIKSKKTLKLDQFPLISNDVLYRRNQHDAQDERFNSYFQNKYSNSQNIMHTFQKTLSNYSFLGVKLSEKTKNNILIPYEPNELYLDNFIGHKHNKKPSTSQSVRSQSSTSKFRFKNLLPLKDTQPDMKNCFERIISNLMNLIENSYRFSKIFTSIDGDCEEKGFAILNVFNDYWEFINSLGIENLIIVFLDKRDQIIVKKALIYEIIYLALTHYFFFISVNETNHYKQTQIFLLQLKKIFFFLNQNYLLLLNLIYHLTQKYPKRQKLTEFQNLKDLISKKLLVFDFNETCKTIKYNNKTLESYNKEFFQVLLVDRTNFLQKTNLFKIFEYFLSTDIIFIEIKELKLQVIQGLTEILKPSGFFSEKNQMKELFLTGSFSSLNIEQIDFDNLPNTLPELPFLPAENNLNKYTLILELEGVLINSSINEENELEFHKRPGLDEFLDELAKFYEIVIYSIGSKEYVDQAVDFFDDKKLIKYKLYKDHNIKINKCFVKDLNLIGRDLKRVVYVDYSVENFQLQEENGVFIKKWDNKTNDKSLENLAFLLKHFAKKKFKDLRKVLVSYRDQAIRLLWNGEKVELI